MSHADTPRIRPSLDPAPRRGFSLGEWKWGRNAPTSFFRSSVQAAVCIYLFKTFIPTTAASMAVRVSAGRVSEQSGVSVTQFSLAGDPLIQIDNRQGKAMTHTIIDRMINSLDEQEHLQLLRDRYLEEGFSRLELKSRHANLTKQISGAEDTSERRLLELELGLVTSQLENTAPPDPTPEQVAAKLAESNPAAAEALKHQIAVDAARQGVEEAQAELADANENDWYAESPGYKRLVDMLGRAQQEYDEKRAQIPPSFARSQQASEHLMAAEALRTGAQDLLDSAESHLVKQGEQMLSQAKEHSTQAQSLRSYLPTVDATDTYADASAEEGGGTQSGPLDRMNKLMIGRMRA